MNIIGQRKRTLKKSPSRDEKDKDYS